MDTFGRDSEAGSARIFSEIGDLADYIKQARQDISALRTKDITEEHLPTAADELDAIVEATEKATDTIFEAVENIENIAVGLPEKAAEEITSHITSVYEACSFQDITGQRINKVVKALKHIEARIEDIMLASGGQEEQGKQLALKRRRPIEDMRADAHLLNGPQLEGKAISQDDIDALLGFD
ncbi:MAG: protein phosphatase CheZ [Kiloniellales bacterium]|nr:protein phosphatase CheZ [Kiloniellales bacterium]